MLSSVSVTALPAAVMSVTTALERAPLGAVATTTSPVLNPLPEGRKTEDLVFTAALATTEPAAIDAEPLAVSSMW